MSSLNELKADYKSDAVAGEIRNTSKLLGTILDRCEKLKGTRNLKPAKREEESTPHREEGQLRHPPPTSTHFSPAPSVPSAPSAPSAPSLSPPPSIPSAPHTSSVPSVPSAPYVPPIPSKSSWDTVTSPVQAPGVPVQDIKDWTNSSANERASERMFEKDFYPEVYPSPQNRPQTLQPSTIDTRNDGDISHHDKLLASNASLCMHGQTNQNGAVRWKQGMICGVCSSNHVSAILPCGTDFLLQILTKNSSTKNTCLTVIVSLIPTCLTRRSHLL